MAERTNPHSEIVVGAKDQATPVFDKIKGSARDMADAVEKSAQNAGKATGDIGKDAQPAAGKIDNATKSIIQSIERATAAMKAGAKGSAGYFEELAKQRGVSGDALKPYIASLREAEAAQKTALLGQQGMAMSAKQTAAALRGVPAQITDIVVSLQGGQAPLTVFLQQGGQLRDMFGGAGAAARALGGAVLGMVNPLTVSLAAVAGLGYAYSQGSKEADAFRLALVSTGSASGATVGQLQQMAASIDGVVGTQAKAAETLALFATQTVAGKASMEQYATAAIAWEQASGESVESVAKKFGSLKDAPLQGVLKLNESMNFLTESVYAQIKSLEEQGKTTEAAKVAQDALANALQDRSAEIVKNLGSIERGWKNVKHAVAETWDAIKGIGRATPPEELLSASRSRVNVMQAEYDYKIQRGMSTGTLGERLEKEKGLLATLQAQVKANADSAQAEADRLTRVNARADADKNALKYLDDKAKMARQIAAERETIQRAYTGKTDAASQKAMEAEIEASEANIRKSYEKTKKVRESAATGENEVASIRAKIAEQTRYLQTMQETGAEYTKLTEGERLVIKINEELQTGLKGAARANKEKALAAAEALVVVEKQVGAEQALAKSNAESEAAYRKDLSSMAQRTDAMDAQAAQLEAANAVYGKGKIAIEEYNLQLDQERLKRLNALGLQGATTEELTLEIEARQRLIAAMKQAEFKAASQRSTESLEQAKAANDLVREEIGLIGMTEVERKKIIAARKAEIELAKELRAIDAMGIDESDKETLRIEARAKSRIDAETNAARAVLDDWQKTADDINRSLTDALLRGFESGKDFAKNLRDTIKNMFSTLVLRPIISAVMTPVSLVINGVVQQGMNAVGLGGGGNLMGMASNASSLYSGASSFNTGWFTNFGATAPGSLYSSGAQLYSQGFETVGNGMMDLGNSMAQYSDAINTAGTWLSYGKAIYDVTQGKYGSAVGTAIGSYFGPIGAAIGGAIGGLVDKWTGSRGANHSGGVYSTATTDRNAAAAGLGLSGGALGDFTQRGNTAIDAQLGKAVGAMGGLYSSLAKYAGGTAKQIDIVAGFAVNGKHKDEDAYGYFKLIDKLTGKELASYSKRDGGLGSDPAKAWEQYVTDMGTALVGEIRKADIPGWMDGILASFGEEITGEELTLALQQIQAVDVAFGLLGVNMELAGRSADDFSGNIVNAMGGLEKFQTAISGYYENYYSGTERLNAGAGELAKGFDELGVAMPRSRQELRGMITATLEAGESGQELAVGLLNASVNFDNFADSLMSLSGLTTDSIKGIFENILEQASSAQEAERMAADAFGGMVMDSMQNAMMTGLSDMVMNSLVAPLMESMLAGAVTSSTVLASGGATAAASMAAGGAYAGAANASGGASAAGSMASGGASAATSMASGGAVAGGVIGSFLDHAKTYMTGFAAVMNDPEVRAALAELGKTFGSVAGSVYSFSGGGGGGSFSGGGGGGGGGGGAASEADKLSDALKRLGETMGNEVKRLRGLMVDDSAQSQAVLLARFTSGTAAARAGDIKAAEALPELSKLLETATAASAMNSMELARMRGWLAGSLEETAKIAGINLPEYAVGTNYVPRTMAAVIHEGESIVPKAFNPWAGGIGGTSQMNTARLEALVERLTEDNRNHAAEIARLNLRMVRIAEHWEAGGMPQPRTERWEPAV